MQFREGVDKGREAIPGVDRIEELKTRHYTL
jgi:hypothetical protein